MGFDVYGIKPIENTKKTGLLTQSWDTISQEDKDKWFSLTEKYEKENPGVYFRNNVWWWRPLWNYVSEVCKDIMTENDKRAGNDNSGNEINKTTTDKMASKLIAEIAQDKHKAYEEKHTQELKDLSDEKCDLCKGTGVRDDENVQGECNGCKGKGHRRPFKTHYPFDTKNVEEFTMFLIESGGIRIC